MTLNTYEVTVTVIQKRVIEAESEDQACQIMGKVADEIGSKTSIKAKKIKNEGPHNSKNKLLAFDDQQGSIYVSPCCCDMGEALEDGEPFGLCSVDENGVNWVEPNTEKWKIRQSCPWCGARIKWVKSSKELIGPIYSGTYGKCDEKENESLLEDEP